MAHSVEVRVPYLDYRIIEFADRLPGALKIKDGVNKYIHKKAMMKLLPRELLARPKEGFVQPVYTWMHTSLKQWAKGHLSCLPSGFFNRSYVTGLVARFDAGDQKVDAKIWNLVCFSIWYNNIFQDKVRI